MVSLIVFNLYRLTLDIAMATTFNFIMSSGYIVTVINLSSIGMNQGQQKNLFIFRVTFSQANGNLRSICKCRLDIGEGREFCSERCSRLKLQQQCIKYLGPVSFLILFNITSSFIHMDQTQAKDRWLTKVRTLNNE